MSRPGESSSGSLHRRGAGRQGRPKADCSPLSLGFGYSPETFPFLARLSRIDAKFLSFLYGWSLLPTLGTASFCPRLCILPSLRDCLSLRPPVHPLLCDSHLSLWHQAVNRPPSGLAEPIRKPGRLPSLQGGLCSQHHSPELTVSLLFFPSMG